MSKLATAFLVAGIAAWAFVNKGEPYTQVSLAPDSMHVSVPVADDRIVFVVTSSDGATCQIISEVGDQSRINVKPEAACAEVVEGLDRVTVWAMGKQGSDVLKDSSGNTILMVGPSDGFAYEAKSQNGSQISFALSEV